MTNDLRNKIGQGNQERVEPLILNEIRLNGETGNLTLVDLLGGKKDKEGNPDEKGKFIERGVKAPIRGVIIKMRWKMQKWDNKLEKYITTSEFDNKNTDEVVVFGSKERGLAVDIKAKYDLPSIRVLYVYSPVQKQTFRIPVKASALTGDKNPNGEKGLFDYESELTKKNLDICFVYTKFDIVHREKNIEKKIKQSHYTYSFSEDGAVPIEEHGTILEQVNSTWEKTTGQAKNFAKTYAEAGKSEPDYNEEDYHTPANDIQYPTQEIDPNDIPF